MVTRAYFDTSALIKRYVTETGSSWVNKYISSTPVPIIFTSVLTAVEATCAFARRLRDGTLTQKQYNSVVANFNHDLEHTYIALDVMPVTLKTARELATQHPLRAYDAVQLATAWLLNRNKLDADQDTLTFVCADERLLKIAQAEKLLTENPAFYATGI